MEKMPSKIRAVRRFLNERLMGEGPDHVGGAVPGLVVLGFIRKQAEQVSHDE